MRIEKPRGTRDFLPDEMEKRRNIEGIMRRIVESFGYREVSTPTFEHLELFTIKSGDEIIEEIYAFKDKSGRDLALRPELTAPVMRLFVNECFVMPKPLRFYYFANCFRYERPQKGRYREFWQFGVELIGSDTPESDAEVIILAYRIMEELSIDFSLHIGHVGLLRKVLHGVDEKERAMRFIDKKEWRELENFLERKGKGELFEKIMELSSSRSIEEAISVYPDFDYSHISKVLGILDSLGIDFKLDFGIARGLDYYTGLVFEIYGRGLGAQNQICGGGSYSLTGIFGKEDVPATGFAIGFDRVAEICNVNQEKTRKVVVIGFGDYSKATKVADVLRREGIPSVVDVMGRSVKKQLSFANSINADYAVFVGEEFKKGLVTVKNLNTGNQREIRFEELSSYIINGEI